jgi:hypothetical protein
MNNLIAIEKKNNENYKTLFRRIHLNSNSFYINKTHIKYINNLVFVCGEGVSAHLEFKNQ